MEGRCFDRSVGRGWEEEAERLPSVAVVFSLSVVRSRTQLARSWRLCLNSVAGELFTIYSAASLPVLG